MRPLFSPILAVAIVSLCMAFFVLVYQWGRPVPLLVCGSSANDAAISRAEGVGKTGIFESGVLARCDPPLCSSGV
jgi:hypothetical protein